MGDINKETIISWNQIKTSVRPIDEVEFVETIYATKEYEDWSGCRSVPRAKRRHKQGIKTAMRVRRKPACYKMDGKMFIHPDLLQAMKKRVSDRIESYMYNAILGTRP